MHAGDLSTLLVQVMLVLALSRATGLLFSRMRQPQVIGEMVAGIMLGPSLLGWVLPDVFGTLFPRQSLDYLNLLSQFGVIFFLFLIGLEFDPEIVRRRGRDAEFSRAVAFGRQPGFFALAFGLRDGATLGNLPLPEDSKPIVLGQVVEGMKPTDMPAEGEKNEPMMRSS